jgi:hypothetical protein
MPNDEIEISFQRARTKRSQGLAPGLLAALTARVSAGEAIGETEITAALEVMMRQANREAFSDLEAEDAAAEAASGTDHPAPAPLDVFSAWECEPEAVPPTAV